MYGEAALVVKSVERATVLLENVADPNRATSGAATRIVVLVRSRLRGSRIAPRCDLGAAVIALREDYALRGPR